MSTTKSTSHVTLKNRDTSVMKGIDKHITTSFTIAGTTYTPAELKALFGRLPVRRMLQRAAALARRRAPIAVTRASPTRAAPTGVPGCLYSTTNARWQCATLPVRL